MLFRKQYQTINLQWYKIYISLHILTHTHITASICISELIVLSVSASGMCKLYFYRVSFNSNWVIHLLPAPVLATGRCCFSTITHSCPAYIYHSSHYCKQPHTYGVLLAPAISSTALRNAPFKEQTVQSIDSHPLKYFPVYKSDRFASTAASGIGCQVISRRHASDWWWRINGFKVDVNNANRIQIEIVTLQVPPHSQLTIKKAECINIITAKGVFCDSWIF